MLNKLLTSSTRHVWIVGFLCLAGLTACKNSSFEEVVSQCLPDCADLNSPIGSAEIRAAFESSVGSAQTNLSKDSLTGRWLMLVSDRYTINTDTEKQVSDVLFTKTLYLNDLDSDLEVSDCFNTEVYSLSQNKSFSIPKSSVFISVPEFENLSAIAINGTEDNIVLNSVWNFRTPQETIAQLDVSMYKVSDSNDATISLGLINTTVDIFCYSYLHLYTIAEQLVLDRWLQGKAEYKELTLKLDEADGLGDDSLTVAITDNDGEESYQMIYDLGQGGEYFCVGSAAIDSQTTNDFLSFSGSLNFLSNPSCEQVVLNQTFSFSGL